MTLNKQSGNMYDFVTHTWNPIKGKCPHECSYCYMKRFKVGELRLDDKCLKDNLGAGNNIFVGSSTDMFANEVPSDWIARVLNYCASYPKNTYLFQTKNPERFGKFSFPDNSTFGTTIESNRDHKISKAPILSLRIQAMYSVPSTNIMISIEPILDFDLETMRRWVCEIMPEFVSIGADSKGSNLPEPSPEKVEALITELKKFTEVKIKDNLKRLR